MFIQMKCIKCTHENPPSALSCESCKVILPQVKDFSLSDTVGDVFYKDDLPVEKKGKKAFNFIPLIRLEEAVDLLLDDEISDDEFEEKVEDALEPLIEIKKIIDNLPSDQWDIAGKGIFMVQEGYGRFKDSIKEILLFLETDEIYHVEEGLEMARSSAEILSKAFLIGTEEIERTAIK